MSRGELVETIKAKISEITAEKATGFFEQSFTGKPLNPELPTQDSNNQPLSITQ